MDKKIIRDIAQKIHNITGVELNESKDTMIRARLSRRMVQLGYRDLFQYFDYFRENENIELQILVSVLTTHTTHFFREYSHFEYLEKTGLPNILETMKKTGSKVLRVWSAGCSAGHEVYSLAMFLEFHLKKMGTDVHYEILGSDIDPEVIEKAREGVYTWQELKEAPSAYLVGQWDRGTGDISSFVRARPTIKNRCEFKVINLMHLEKEIPQGTVFDLIFCRNVFIYFSQDFMTEVAKKMLRFLSRQGLMVLGMSESLFTAKEVDVEPVYPSIYRKLDPTVKVEPGLPSQKQNGREQDTRLQLVGSSSMSGPKEGRIRVLCVDDSPTVLSILKQVLTEEHGFEVVGTAAHGEEAAEFLKQQSVDVVTLDIHMPVQDGVEYLRRHFSPTHPPVVVVSSVSREDMNLGIRALELGAADYVEKPSIGNFLEISDQIRTKLRFLAKTSRTWKMNLELENAFKRTPVIFNAREKLRLIVSGIKDRDVLLKVLGQLQSPQPPTFVLISGAESLLEALKLQMVTSTFGHAKILDGSSPQELESDQLWLGCFSKSFESLKSKYSGRKTSMLIFGDQSIELGYKLSQWKDCDLLIEDLMGEFGQKPTQSYLELKKISTSISPVTSFAYLSCVYLCDRPPVLSSGTG